jgi:NAD+ kinase
LQLLGGMRAFRNIMVVVKQTPYEQYLQLKNQGKAPVALRWARLKNRYDIHRECVDKTTDLLKKLGVNFSVVGRDEMHRGLLWEKDLVICVGGDGTMLSTACFLDENIPLLGINSDPTGPDELAVTNVKDERRSRGALCAVSKYNMDEILPKIICGALEPRARTRLQCIVKSTYTETRLPPALNDVLIAHPSPAAVSRFRLTLNRLKEPTIGTPSSYLSPAKQQYRASTPAVLLDELFSFNVWSSGMWVSTATGSTAAMHAAGGYAMDPHSRNLQYMVRERLVEEGGEADTADKGHGDVSYDQMLHLRWNSQRGCIFVDGSHSKHELQLGDEVTIEAHAPIINIFERPVPGDTSSGGSA